MGDLKSKRWIVAKGVMFLCMAVLAAGLILAESPSLQVAALLAVLVWSACRFYYFLFYVLERYVDPQLRYTGMIDLGKHAMGHRRSVSQQPDCSEHQDQSVR